MNSTISTWIFVVVGMLIIAGIFLWNRYSDSDSDVESDSIDDDTPYQSGLHKTKIVERIRQIALIEKDEFSEFYHPVLQTLAEYEKVLGEKKIDRKYFETIYKALRKRRSAIFEYGSSERDQEKKALWTYALFCTLSLRYVIKRLQTVRFSHQRNRVCPYLVDIKTLSRCDIQPTKCHNTFQADILNIHLLDKIIDKRMILKLVNNGIYQFVINGVSGFYQERINPFYTIIEQVESHLNGFALNATEVFNQNLKHVLELIERGTFSMNQKSSLVFEGMSCLLIDRNFLWELYRGYAVNETRPFGKKEFESQLVEELNIDNVTKSTTIYRVTIDGDKIDGSQEKVDIELWNMIALNYKAVPYYQFSDRKRIQKETLQRGIVQDDTSRGTVEDHSIVQPVEENNLQTKSHFPKDQSSSVGLKDLFSDQ